MAVASAFFLPAPHDGGQRFCLYHAPDPAVACRGGLVYAAPLGEEMNRARRMAALQARALAGAGCGVLLLDLAGCGDSSGDSSQAHWQTWIEDLLLAQRWLAERLALPPAQVGFWGLRLGATLALAAARRLEGVPLLLWNPVLNGTSYLTQLLRLRLAGDMLNQNTGGGVTDLRAQLQAGQVLEIGGHMLSPALAQAIDTLDADALAPPPGRSAWLELLRAGMPLPASLQAQAARWQQTLHPVTGPAFWSTPDVTTSPALIERSCTLFSALVEGQP